MYKYGFRTVPIHVQYRSRIAFIVFATSGDKFISGNVQKNNIFILVERVELGRGDYVTFATREVEIRRGLFAVSQSINRARSCEGGSEGLFETTRKVGTIAIATLKLPVFGDELVSRSFISHAHARTRKQLEQ